MLEGPLPVPKAAAVHTLCNYPAAHGQVVSGIVAYAPSKWSAQERFEAARFPASTDLASSGWKYVLLRAGDGGERPWTGASKISVERSDEEPSPRDFCVPDMPPSWVSFNQEVDHQ